MYKPLQAHPNSSRLSSFPLTYLEALLSPKRLFPEKSRAQCNGCRGEVGDGPQRVSGIAFPHLKFQFTGFVSLARSFLVVELTFLSAGIKVSGS